MLFYIPYALVWIFVWWLPLWLVGSWPCHLESSKILDGALEEILKNLLLLLWPYKTQYQLYWDGFCLARITPPWEQSQISAPRLIDKSSKFYNLLSLQIDVVTIKCCNVDYCLQKIWLLVYPRVDPCSVSQASCNRARLTIRDLVSRSRSCSSPPCSKPRVAITELSITCRAFIFSQDAQCYPYIDLEQESTFSNLFFVLL